MRKLFVLLASAVAVVACQSGGGEAPVVPDEPAAEGADGPEVEKASALVERFAKPSRAPKQVVTKLAATKIAPMKVADAFALARQSGAQLAVHPKLKQLMPKHIATLDSLEKLASELDRIATAAPQLGTKEAGAAKTDAERIQQKAWEMMESIADSDIDEAKNNYEEAKEQFKLAMRIIAEHMERQTQVIQKMTS